MQGALNCVENWCREIDLSANRSDNNYRKIWGFYNPRLFGTELRMTDQVKYLGVILDKKFYWRAHLENRMRKACIAYWLCCRGNDLGIITECGGWAQEWSRKKLRNCYLTCSGWLVWELLVVCVQHQRLL
jgi:hypothetical protein